MAEIIEAGSAAARTAGGAADPNDRRQHVATAGTAYGNDEPAAYQPDFAEDATGANLADDADEAVVDAADVDGADVDGAADVDVDGAAGAADGDGVDATDEVDDEAEEDGGARGAAIGSRTEDLLVREGDVAGDYLERLLDLLDYDGDIDLDVEAGRAIVSIDGGDDLQKLVGQNGSALEALQELTRLAVQQETGVRSRLMLDVAQWRAGRRTELSEIGREAAQKALSTGNSVKLAPMTPFERKIVHDAVARVSGVHSESEGEEPRRRVVVFRTA